MVDELKSHQQNGTWELVDPPEGRKVVGCRWVYKLKRNAAGEITKYKARLVAQGYSQKYGVDYDEVFAPVTSHTTLRVLLAVASKRRMTLKHFDVKTAYLYGDLDEEIFMRQPPGFAVKGREDMVCRLKKSIYGLKQSARCWNQRLHSVLVEMGFEQSATDSCLYTKVVSGKRVYLLVYVDDIMIGCEDEAQIDSVYEQLKRYFEVTNLGEPNDFLGLKIECKDRKYSVSVGGYIDRVADRFGLREAKRAKTPMEEGFASSEDESPKLSDDNEYRSLVGALLYISVCARPDVAASVAILGRKVSSPSEADWVAAKRVVRYLKATKEWKLSYGDAGGQLVGYSDADWAGDAGTRKSTTGFVFNYAGGAVSWVSRRQKPIGPATRVRGSLRPDLSSTTPEEQYRGSVGGKVASHCLRWNRSTWR
ncbi:hypothetical protein RP20_CCG008066 [Aedes albopictus]|nr:hypothetical protein RP20_CCG008066 [Aedes albopictus]